LSLVTSQAQADAAGQGDDVSVTSPSTAQLTPTTPKMLEAANSTAAKVARPPLPVREIIYFNLFYFIFFAAIEATCGQEAADAARQRARDQTA